MAETREKIEVATTESATPTNATEVTTQSSNVRAVFICLFAMCGSLLFGIENGLAAKHLLMLCGVRADFSFQNNKRIHGHECVSLDSYILQGNSSIILTVRLDF